MKLIHLTYKQYLNSILNNGFLISKHEPNEKKIMWLGDGVYFYNSNDEEALKQGTSLLKNKRNKPKDDEIVILESEVDISKENILNILDETDMKFVISYIRNKSNYYSSKANTELQNTEEDLIMVLLHLQYFLPFNNEKYGKTLGSLINDLLIESKGIQIDLVTCSFVTRRQSQGKEEESIEQHALKNLEKIEEVLYSV